MAARYFQESESSIKPGQVSQELRRAIGLRDNQLPMWIYRMRALGYPPGWLKKAKVSSLELFDDTGKRKAEDTPTTYDPEKFIVYPGFNAPVPPGIVDAFHEHNMPPMLPHQQLDYARKHMDLSEPLRPPKRRRTDHEKEEGEADSDSDEDHGEGLTYDSEAESVDETSGEVAEVQEVNTDDEDDDDSVVELIQSGKLPTKNSCDPSESKEEESSEKKEETHIKNLDREAAKTSEASDDNDESNQEDNDGNETKLNETKDTSIQLKIISAGSPLPKSCSKPRLEKFSEGMSELLYFQNLPESTGMFDRMRNVLKRVRQHLVKR